MPCASCYVSPNIRTSAGTMTIPPPNPRTHPTAPAKTPTATYGIHCIFNASGILIPNFTNPLCGHAKFAPKGLHDKTRRGFCRLCKVIPDFSIALFRTWPLFGQAKFGCPRTTAWCVAYLAKLAKFDENLATRPFVCLLHRQARGGFFSLASQARKIRV